MSEIESRRTKAAQCSANTGSPSCSLGGAAGKGNEMRIKIDFDFGSSGVWDADDGCCIQDPAGIGLSKELADSILEWNDLFDRIVFLDSNRGVRGSSIVTERVADLMEPMGIALAKLVKKELPDAVVIYHYYNDEKEGARKDIIV